MSRRRTKTFWRVHFFFNVNQQLNMPMQAIVRINIVYKVVFTAILAPSKKTVPAKFGKKALAV